MFGACFETVSPGDGLDSKNKILVNATNFYLIYNWAEVNALFDVIVADCLLRKRLLLAYVCPSAEVLAWQMWRWVEDSMKVVVTVDRFWSTTRCGKFLEIVLLAISCFIRFVNNRTVISLSPTEVFSSKFLLVIKSNIWHFMR